MIALTKNNDLDFYQDSNGNSSTNNIFVPSTARRPSFLLKKMKQFNKNNEISEDYNITSTSRNTIRDNHYKSKTILLPPISNNNRDTSYQPGNQLKERKDFYGNEIKKGGKQKVSFLDDVNSIKSHMSNLRHNYTRDETLNDNNKEKKKNFISKKKKENEFIQIIQVDCFKKLNKKNSYVIPKNFRFPSKTVSNCQCCCIT